MITGLSDYGWEFITWGCNPLATSILIAHILDNLMEVPLKDENGLLIKYKKLEWQRYRLVWQGVMDSFGAKMTFNSNVNANPIWAYPW